MKKIIMSGAGPVGSLLAVYLAKRGYEVEMYERRPDMRRTDIPAGRSINLALSDRGWRGLEQAGVAEEIRRVSVPMKGRMVHDESARTNFLAYGREDQAIWSASRRAINVALMDCAEATGRVKIFFDERTMDVDLENARLTLESTAHGQRTVEGDCVIGADGAFSALRHKMQFLDRFDYSQDYLEHGYKELSIPPGKGGEFLLEKNALHIWPRHQYMMIALPNPDGSFTCTLFFPFEGNPSFSMLKTKADVTKFFNEIFPDAAALMPDLEEDFFENPSSSLVTVRCYPWKYKGKALLIGDAAHAVVPFYGQGMNAGFEDCRIFDTLLEENPGDFETIFEKFQVLRKPNADAIAQLALYNFIEMRDLVSDPDFLLRKRLEKKISELYPEKFSTLYSMVTFSHIPYAEVLERSRKQDAMVDRIIGGGELEKKLESGEIEAEIRRVFEA